MNRRLNIFGSFALDELIQESPRNTAGNYALQDVQAALQWLRDNVDQFNGDPNRIILVGESAGATLLCHVLSSPDTAGLISAAIIQSGGCGVRLRLNDSIPIFSPFENALNLHRPVLAAAGCDLATDPLQCLRDLPAADVLAAAQLVDLADGVSGTFRMIVDGIVVASDPHTALINEIAGPIPVIIGSTDNEGGGGFSGTPPVDDAEYRARLSGIFGAPLDNQIYTVYPTADFASVADAWRIFWADWIFNCVAEELARSASGNTPAYLYNFSRGFSTGSRAGLGAVHAIDVPFLFETYDVFGHTPDADDAAVTDAMQNAWTALATDPTAAPPYLPSGASSWPPFDINNVQIVNFNAPMTIDTEHRAGRCSLLRNIISL
jgi:para-nitrobenzyl esterase